MNTRRRSLIIVALVIAVFGGTLWGARLFASSPDRPLTGPAACTEPDCVIYDLTTQVDCWQVEEGPTGESRWYDGLSTQVDQELRRGEIVAYKIRWSTGEWSDWFVTGMNDLDIKFNPKENTMRRMWSYFYDHEHTYIICGNRS